MYFTRCIAIGTQAQHRLGGVGRWVPMWKYRVLRCLWRYTRKCIIHLGCGRGLHQKIITYGPKSGRSLFFGFQGGVQPFENSLMQQSIENMQNVRKMVSQSKHCFAQCRAVWLSLARAWDFESVQLMANISYFTGCNGDSPMLQHPKWTGFSFIILIIKGMIIHRVHF